MVKTLVEIVFAVLNIPAITMAPHHYCFLHFNLCIALRVGAIFNPPEPALQLQPTYQDLGISLTVWRWTNLTHDSLVNREVSLVFTLMGRARNVLPGPNPPHHCLALSSKSVAWSLPHS
jgi:hypothetical protein